MPYLGRSSNFGVRTVFQYLPSAGDTSVSGADANGKTLSFADGNYVDVYLNGVKLKTGTDYNTTTANTIAGLTALASNDEVTVVVYDAFSLATGFETLGGTFGGAVTISDTTASSSATTGALIVSGGVGVAADLSVGDDLRLISDSSVLSFGADSDVTVTHDPDDGLILKSTATGDDNPFLLTLQTGETDIAADDVLGAINFQAPDEGTGTDAILVAAGIEAVSEGDFSSSSNATKLVFKTGSSETATEKMSLSSGGQLTITRADNGTQLLLQSTDADANVGPLLDLNRDSGSPADSDFLGKIQFSADDDAGNKLNYAFIDSKILDASNGSEDGQLDISTVQGGSAISRLQFNTATVFNEDSADVDFRVESNGNTHALFVDAGNDHVNINTDTDLGSDLNINGEVTIANANSGIIMVENAADAFGSNFTMRKSRNTTLNGHTVVQEDDVTGNINFQGSDGTDFHSTASIQSAVDDTPGNNDMPGRLMFSTTANSGSSPAERMRIDESGRVLIGTTQTLFDNAQTLQVSGSQACNMRSTVASADGGHVIGLQRSGNTQGDYIRFFDSSGNETGQIRVDSGGTCQFEDVSDYRLKDNIKDWDVDASAKVKQVKIRTFDWKDQTAVTNGKNLVGVIAHELQEVYPHCVTGKKDGYGEDVDKDGNKKPMYQGVDYGKLTPLLTKALQEALARIDTLEAEVAKLKG